MVSFVPLVTWRLMTSAKFSHCSRPGSSFYGKIANFLEIRKFSDGTTFQLLILPFFFVFTC